MNATLLFMMGIDLASVFVILFLLTGFALAIFFLSTYVLQKIFRDLSKKRIFLFSVLSVWILIPVAFLILFWILVELTPNDQTIVPDPAFQYDHSDLSEEEYYESLDVAYRELKKGMTKREVLELLGDNDTTTNTMVYDFSLPRGKNKYVLVVEFENNEVVSYTKGQSE